MAINTYRFWMATDANRLLANQNAFIQAAAPSFYQGNVAQLELHIVASAGVGTSPVEVPFPAGAAISVAVGDTNTYPTGGSWELMVGTTETGPMPYNATTIQVAAALNALTEVSSAGGVTVSKTGDGYTITWNTYGLKPTIGIGSDTLTPSSYESISLVQTGSAEHRQIVFVELRQNPIALSTTWTPLATPSVTVSEVQAWNGTNRIWRVSITPQPKAGSITIAYGTKTATLAYNASPASIAAALSPAQVFATGQYQWDIVIAEDSVLTAFGSLIGYNGYSGSINFATAECHQFLAGAERKGTMLEVSISIDDKRYTLIQTPCNVFADVVSDGVIQPLPLGVAMSEQVANARFVRRDIDQNPDASTLDAIWPNLGVETLGSDVAGALNAADSPSAANPFATISDLSGLGSVWGSITGTLSDQTDLQLALDDKYDASNPDGFVTEPWVASYVAGTSYPLTNPEGFITGAALTGYATESWVFAQGFATEGWVQSQGYLTSVPPPDLANLTTDISWSGLSGRLLISGVAGPEEFYGARLNIENNTVPSQPNDGDVWRQNDKFRYSFAPGGTQTIASEYYVNSYVTGEINTLANQIVANYVQKSGGTYTGKVNFTSSGGQAGLNVGIGGTSTNATVNGDLWITTGGTNLNFRDGTGSWRILVNTSNTNTFSSPQIIDTTATTAALRLTQKGTGNAIEVEDSTSPDTTRFVVDQFGKVGVGTAPDATAAIKLDGNGISFNGLVFNPTGTASHTGGTDTLDLLVTINGVNYRLGLRPA
jgi:hypothetical protein